jgi:hypothetical protein
MTATLRTRSIPTTPPADGTVAEMLQLLDLGVSSIAVHACVQLGRLGALARPALPALRRKSRHSAVRVAARRAMHAILVALHEAEHREGGLPLDGLRCG